ncbi:MAG: hypothetical protein FWG39_00460 [Alphaproteobacteria bacterium]|nr:hypothetical protein [Alphaproteobacteria bacterium]
MVFKKDSKKRAKTKKPAAKSPRIAAAYVPATRAMPAPCGRRLARNIYFGIILFFASATFYIMGRSYSILNPGDDHGMAAAIIDMTAMSHEERAVLANEYFAYGRGKLVSGNGVGAILDFSIAIEANPDDVMSHIYRGEAHLQVGDLSKAVYDFTSAINLDDENPVAWYDRALAYIRQENFKAAMRDLDAALERNTLNKSDMLSNRDIYSRRAQLRLWAKDFDASAEDYTVAIAESALDPVSDDYAGRAEAYTGAGAYAPAARDYVSAITIISEKIQTAQTSEEREQMSRDAMSYFEKSAALNVVTSDFIAARGDLESALTIATALKDADAMERLGTLLNGM